MYALSDESRQQLLRLSLMIVCGGTAILPFTVPPTSPAARAATTSKPLLISVPDVPGKLEFPAISIERDPFAADASVLGAEDHPFTTVNGSTGSEEIGIVLPPNDGARGTPAAVAPADALPLVRGIVLGEAPQALIDFGSGVKVVSVGDAVGDQTIRAIDAGGVTLSSGLRLRIASSPR